jgi:phenylacetate-CoA ligase
MGPSPSAREVQPAPDATIALLDATIARARGSTLYRERLACTRIRTLDDLRAVPLTTRGDLQAAGTHGTRALPLEQVCHYGESSGTSGASNSTWLTAGDFLRDAHAIRASHPAVFAPGRIILNRYPFMAAPAHIIQPRAGGRGVPRATSTGTCPSRAHSIWPAGRARR